jgi:hypothetical protein
MSLRTGRRTGEGTFRTITGEGVYCRGFGVVGEEVVDCRAFGVLGEEAAECEDVVDRRALCEEDATEAADPGRDGVRGLLEVVEASGVRGGRELVGEELVGERTGIWEGEPERMREEV